MVNLKIFLNLLRNRFLEIFIFFLFYILIGFLYNKTDPLLIQFKFSPLIILLLFITLFYGLVEGILIWTFVILVEYLLYKKVFVFESLWFLSLVLVAGYFKYHWQMYIEKLEVERDHYKSEIDKMRKMLYLTKLSHDQLEFNYLTKPYSLRNLLKEIGKILLKNDLNTIFNYISTILTQNFKIYKALLVEYHNNKFYPLSKIGISSVKLDKETVRLLKRAIDSEKIYYLPLKNWKLDLIHNETPKYLAIIPIKTEKKTYLLIIEDMNFLFFNEDTLTSLYILLSYIFEDIDLRDEILNTFQNLSCSFEFLKELYKMYKLYTKTKVISSLAIFKYDGEIPDDIIKRLEFDVRFLDKFCILKTQKLIIFLLPFTDYTGAEGFVKRILKKYKNFSLVDIREINNNTIKELNKL